MENYELFFGTEFEAMFKADGNDILRVLSDIPRNNKSYKQTLIFIALYHSGNEVIVINQVRKMYERKHCDVVLWCFSYNQLCRRSEEWLPIQNKYQRYELVDGRLLFNPHAHQILMDLMINPQYDWRERYTRNVEMHCQTTKRHVYFWSLDPFLNGNPDEALLVFRIWKNFFHNAKFYNTEIVLHIPPLLNADDYDYYVAIAYSSFNTSRDKSKDQTKQWIRRKEVTGDINIVVYHNEHDHVAKSLFTTQENTVKVIISDQIKTSPLLLTSGDIMVWEEDVLSPYFAKIIFERIKPIICN